jgi:hypothetical protein
MHRSGCTYLDGTKDPKDQRLDDDEGRRPDAECKVDPNVLADIRILAFLAVDFGPLLQPNAAPCVQSVSETCCMVCILGRSAGEIPEKKEKSRSRWLNDLSRLSTDQHETIYHYSEQIASLCILEVH